MKQMIEIDVPKGKKAIWKDNKIVLEDIISSETLVEQLPKTWEEFCQQNKVRDENNNRNMMSSEQDDEQHLAFKKIRQLRDCYRKGWQPSSASKKYVIERYFDPNIGDFGLRVTKYFLVSMFLSFQTESIAKEFLSNFKGLIEQAGDFI